MKYFVIAADGAKSIDRDILTMFLKTRNLAWWHWFDGLWLLAEPDDSATTVAWRDSVTKLMPGSHVIVLEVEPKDWAARAPKMGNDWLQSNWSRPSALLASLLLPPADKK